MERFELEQKLQDEIRTRVMGDGFMKIVQTVRRNGKLFKIVLWQDYSGSLPNGISIGMQVSEAKTLDPTLEYDEWNEDYESSSGYWLEDDAENGRYHF